MTWQEELRNALRTAEDLASAGFIEEREVAQYRVLLNRYSFLLPPYYASLIDRRDRRCPIRKQAIPSLDESQELAGFVRDPFLDLKYKPVGRITHRYPAKVLFHLTSNCSMVCRFCFRKSLLGKEKPGLFEGSILEAIRYIRDTIQVSEVIFSGGDPLMVQDSLLGEVLKSLEEIPHVQRIRLHTRVPVTLPSRINRDLAKVLSQTAIPCRIVTHFNHPKEVTPWSTQACSFLLDEKIVVLNQSVLLRGVNDDPHSLAELWKKLHSIGIQNYYLHHPDRASGTYHFGISMEEGLAIYTRAIKSCLTTQVPRYVVDLGDCEGKTEVSSYLRRLVAGSNRPSSSSMDSESIFFAEPLGR